VSFLAPFFLLGLGAISIPIVVHLIQRERKRVVEFPSLMFIRRIPYQSVRRRRIRNWPLLLLRLAALALIVAIGLVRIYLNLHYPLDVLGGWIAGAALLSVLVAVHILVVDERMSATLRQRLVTGA